MKKIIMLISALLSISVHAYEPDRALVNFSHEAAECSAYFLFSSAAPGLDEKTVKGLRSKSAAMLQVAVAGSNKEVSDARVELAIKSMKREMKENWSNMSIINNKYGYKCFDFGKDIEGRMKYWLEKSD